MHAEDYGMRAKSAPAGRPQAKESSVNYQAPPTCTETMAYLLAIDPGTSSSRSIVFNESGEIVALAQREFTQIFRQPGWVEHDPMEIWRTQLETAREALTKAELTANDIRAIGITNQRETTLVWNRLTGE